MNDRTGPSCDERFSAGDVIKTRSRCTFLFLIDCPPKCEVTVNDKSVVSSAPAVSYTYLHTTRIFLSSEVRLSIPCFGVCDWGLCEFSVIYWRDMSGGSYTCFMLYKRRDYLENYLIQYSYCQITNGPCHGSGDQSPMLDAPWLRRLVAAF
jgi:hypothetical protein